MAKNKYTEEQLKNSSLNFLRSYARELGGTPSLKNKEELVRYILDIQDGKVIPTRNKSGRKPLDFSGADYRLITMLRQSGEAADSASNYATLSEDENIEGILHILPEGIGVLSEKKDGRTVYVSQVMMDGFWLRECDRIAASCEVRNNAIVVSQIADINGKDSFSVGKRRVFVDVPPIYPDEKISFSDMGGCGKTIDLFSPIGKGQRAIIILPKFTDEIEFIESLSNSLELNRIYPIVSYVNCRPEDGELLTHVVKEAISTSFDKDAEEHKSAFRQAEERAIRLAETGYDVALIVGSFSAAKDAIEDFESEVKRLFATAKNTSECKSITVIVLSDDVNLPNKYENYCNSFTVIDGNSADPMRSYTRRSGALLSTDEADVADAVRKALASGKDKSFIEECLNRSQGEGEFLELLKSAANLP